MRRLEQAHRQAKPETIMSIGLRDWAHVGQYFMPLV
jgi:hypothetical protein